MKLCEVQIENFKCIEDSGMYSIAPVTCLVGKNESGKTAILQALHKLNPDMPESNNFNALHEYPRRKYSKYKLQQESNPDNVLTTVWELEDDDIKSVTSKLGDELFKKNQVTIKKGYDNSLFWDIEIDEKKIINRLC